MQDSFSFGSKELQKVFVESKEILSNIVGRKNSISNDIKNLEKYLATTDIESDFTLQVTEMDDFIVPVEGIPGGGDVLLYKKFIQWNVATKRLIFIQQSAPGRSCDYEFYPQGEFITITEKPLIETGYDIRKEMYPYLANFLKELTKEYT